MTRQRQPSPQGVSPALVERMLTPLLDNARRYAATAVTLTFAQTPAGVELAVTDDGPGVPAEIGPAALRAGPPGGSGRRS